MEIWILMQGEIEIGRLSLCEVDQPMFLCKFDATNHFASIEPLFNEELALLNQDKMDEWLAAYDKIDALHLRLVSVDNTRTIDDFVLHIEGNSAWFRY